MSLRSKTEKAKKFGTPTTPTTPSTPKAPSPKKPKIVTSTPAGSAVVSSGTPKIDRPSPRTQFQVGDITQTGFQRTPTEIETQIQNKYREMTTGFARTIGLDFNAMSSSVKKIQSLTSQIIKSENLMDILQPDAFGRAFFQAQRDEYYREKDKIKQLEEEITQVQAEEVHNQLDETINKIITAINKKEIIAPEWFQQSISWVQSGHMSQQQFLDSYEHLTNQGLIHEPIIEEEIITEEIEILNTWWVIKPSGIIEELTVSQKFVDTMTAKGWIFSKDKPIIEEPEIFGETEVVLTDQVKQIISDIENGLVVVPDWFVKNIEWVKSGHISPQEFVTAYNYAKQEGWIHAPTEEQEKEVSKKPSPKNGAIGGASALGLVAVLVLIGTAVTVYKKEGN